MTSSHIDDHPTLPPGGDASGSILGTKPLGLVAEQVGGQRVLHIGCGDGALTRLFAESCDEVIGIDPDPGSIDVARSLLAEAPDSVRSRVRFDRGDPARLTFQDASFDTVVLDTVLGRAVRPELILEEAARLMASHARVVVVEPFGQTQDSLHLRAYSPSRLLELLEGSIVPASGTIAGRWMVIVGHAGGDRHFPTEVEAQLRRQLEQVALDVTDELLSAQAERAATVARLTEIQDGTIGALEAVRHAVEAVKDAEIARLERDRDEQLEKSNAELEGARREIKALESQHADAVRQLGQARADAASKRRRIEKLEQERARLRDDLAIAKWRLASFRARKWWRLGGLLGEARRKPRRVLLLPFDVVSLLGRPSELPPRPRPQLPVPRGVAGESSSTTSTLQRAAPRPPLAHRSPPIPRRHLSVAAIVRPSLSDALAHEWQQFDLGSTNWENVLERQRPSLLVIDPDAVAGSHSDFGGGLAERDIRPIVERYRSAGVRSVGLVDRPGGQIDDLIDVLMSFDGVVAFDGDTERRCTEAGITAVLARPGVQPRLFNPIRDRSLDGDVVCFGGCEGIEPGLLGAARDIGLSEIRFGEQADEGVSGMFRVEDLEWLAKRYKVALSAVGASHAERSLMLSLAATGTPVVVSGDPVDVEPGVVTRIGDVEEARSLLRLLVSSRAERTRRGHQAMRTAIRHHHMANIADSLLGAAGLVVATPPPPHVTIMAPTNRPDRLEAVLDNVARQTYPHIDLVLVTHGFDPDDYRLQSLAEERNIHDLHVVRVSEEIPAGEVFNRGFREARGDLIAKVDDDDWYGAEYLWDQVDAMEFSRAEVVGKWAHYCYIESLDSTVLRFAKHEHEYRDVLAISTLLMRREVFEISEFPPMPYGAGSVFLRDLVTNGCRLYSADRFNYIYHRYSRADHHTFPVSDLHIAANGRTISHGYTTAVADV